MALADLLRKPIVPIMLCATPWPPPGKKPSSIQISCLSNMMNMLAFRWNEFDI